MAISDNVTIALIGLVVVVVPIISMPLTAIITNRLLRRDKDADAAIRKQEKDDDAARVRREREEDREAIARNAAEARTLIERQTELAVQAAEAAKAVAQKADATAALLAKNTAQAVEATKVLTKNVSDVHLLVNNNLTLATKDALKAKHLALELLIENIDLKKAGGMEVAAEAMAKIAVLRSEIKSLEDTLIDREKQAALVEAKHPAAAGKGGPLPVADDRVAASSERAADALERSAAAAEATEKKKP